MLARVLNIWVIKQRAQSPPPHHPASTSPSPVNSPDPPPRLTEYLVCLDSTAFPAKIRLRGSPDDLAAITSQAWLRAKTHAEGYLEAAAKLVVYLVACLSGNMTQAGAMIFMGLLIVSAGLLALSNAHAKGYRMNGRVAAVLPEGDRWEKRNALPYPVNKGEDGLEEDRRTSSWPGSSDVSGFTGMNSGADIGRIGEKKRTAEYR